MGIDRRFIGKSYGPYRYEVGAEKIREFAWAIGGGVPSSSFPATAPPEGLSPLYFDEERARALGQPSIVAPPTFCVNFNLRPFATAVSDSDLGINLLFLVHGEQEFELLEPVRPGDVMSTTGTLREIYEKSGKDFVVLVSESTNQAGRIAVRGTYMAVIRQG